MASGVDGGSVGECWVAFQWTRRLGQIHDVTLLTYRRSNGAPVAPPQLPGVRVIEWPDIPLFEKWERFNALLKPGYVTFCHRARKWIKDQLRSGETIDLIHQITPNALRYPSPAVGLGVPFIIGPRGGCLETPRNFDADFGKVPWYTRLRKTDRWRLRHDPLLRRTYSQAGAILAMAPYVTELLGPLPPRVEVEMMPDVGVMQLPPERSQPRGEAGRLRLLFVGRVIRSKGLRDAIRAIAQLKDISGLTLDVVGEGEDMEPCRDEASALGVSDRITFHGRKPRTEVDTFYANSDVFLFPSFREPSGGVVVEAMSHGLPMIVAERGGPGFMVDESCGFRVPASNPEQFASEIATCIRKLSQNPALIASMGKAAREKIRREYMWDVKVSRVNELYSRVLARCEASKRAEQGKPALAT